MNETLLANLFFIITGSAVLVVAAFVCVVCYHAIKIERTARKILHRVEAGTEVFIEDVRVLRDRIANGNIFGRIIAAVVGALTAVKKRRTSSRGKNGITNEE